MQKTYLCYVKSHSPAPDFETRVIASSKKEAARTIYLQQRGELDFDYILKNLERIDNL